MRFDFPAELQGPLVRLRQLRGSDREGLYEAARDPRIWEQHPEPRHRRAVFDAYFDSLAGGGAYLVLDAGGERVLGCASYIDYQPEAGEVEIGSTFLRRECWGGAHNREVKRLLLAHAFQFARSAVFYVHPDNPRSQRALEKLGARRAGERAGGELRYRLEAAEWHPHAFDLQPRLRGAWVHLRPLAAADFEPLYAAARDPLIWEQHPAERWREPVFREYFQGALESGGALLALDAATGEVIGASRFHHFRPEASEIEIGYTFLKRSHWGGRHNGDMKALMLRHALQFVGTVCFLVAPGNLRSQRAVEKIGGVRVGVVAHSSGLDHVLYHVRAPGRDILMARTRVAP